MSLKRQHTINTLTIRQRGRNTRSDKRRWWIFQHQPITTWWSPPSHHAQHYQLIIVGRWCTLFASLFLNRKGTSMLKIPIACSTHFCSWFLPQLRQIEPLKHKCDSASLIHSTSCADSHPRTALRLTLATKHGTNIATEIIEYHGIPTQSSDGQMMKVSEMFRTSDARWFCAEVNWNSVEALHWRDWWRNRQSWWCTYPTTLAIPLGSTRSPSI